MIPARLVVLVATAIAWIAFASQTGAEHAHHTPPTHQFPAAKTTTVLDWEHRPPRVEFTADHSCTQVTVRHIGMTGVRGTALAGADHRPICRFRVHIMGVRPVGRLLRGSRGVCCYRRSIASPR